MYRRAQFFEVSYPLTLDAIKSRFAGINVKSREVLDKNGTGEKIILDCDFDNKREEDYSYLLGASLEFQFHPRRNLPWVKTRDFFAFMFFPREQMLVVLGRDEALTEVVRVVSDILYDNTDRIKMFRSVMFEKQSLIDTINKMKQNDPTGESWCAEYNAIHDGGKFKGEKTITNFSLGPYKCVFDHPDAQDEMANATSISPKYRFKSCPELNTLTYSKPKTMSFNGKEGVISISVTQEFENWYRFVSKFIVKNITCD